MRTSPLYITLQALIEEKSAQLQPYKIKALQSQEQGREAFIVEFTEPPDVPLFDKKNYAFVERHLCVDKDYTQEETTREVHGFSIMHYTETYSNLTNNQQLIIHCYLNKHGQYNSCQVKLYAGDRRETNEFSVVPISPEFETYIRLNYSIADSFITMLNIERNQRYIAATENITPLEERLTQLSLRLYKLDIRRQYIDIAGQIIEKLKVSLQYSENAQIQQGKIRFFLSLITRLSTPEANKNAKLVVGSAAPAAMNKQILLAAEEDEQQEQAFTQGQTAAQEQPATQERVRQRDPKNKATKQGKVVRISSSVDRFSAIFAELKKIEKNLDTCLSILQQDIYQNIQLLIDNYSSIKQGRDILLEMSFTRMSKKQSQQRKNLIARLEEKIAKLPTIDYLFMAACGARNFKLVQQIFTNHTIYISVDAFMSLLAEVIYSQEPQVFIDICDYLYEYSEEYRTWMLKFGTVPIPEFGPMPPMMNSPELFASFLIRACSVDNFPVFVMILRHGVNPNHRGVFYKGNIISTIKAITYYAQDVKYLQTAFYYGLSPVDKFIHERLMNHQEIKHNLTPVRQRILKRQQRKIDPRPRQSVREMDNMIESTRNITDFDQIEGHHGCMYTASPLHFACHKPDDVMLSYLLPFNPLWEVAHALAIQISGWVITIECTTDVNIKCYPSGQVLDEAVIQLQPIPDKASSQKTSLFIYPGIKVPFLQQELLKISTLIEAFKNKYSKLHTESPHLLDEQYDLLFNKGEQALKANKYKEALQYFMACKFMLVYTPEHTFMTHQKIIQIFGKIIISATEQFKLLTTLDSSKIRSTVLYFLEVGTYIVNFSLFKKQLLATPIYKWIMNKCRRWFPAEVEQLLSSFQEYHEETSITPQSISPTAAPAALPQQESSANEPPAPPDDSPPKMRPR